MSDPATIARKSMDAWNRRDWDASRSLMAPGYSYTGGDGQRQDGPEAGMAVARMFATAFPDGKIDIQHVHVAGDTALVEFIGSGTHKGDLMGIAPTGRKISIPVCDILEIKDGKIVAEREYMDMAHIMQQLGVMPAPATA
jgi:steroid delta-isomerase-like uncharacterized protein